MCINDPAQLYIERRKDELVLEITIKQDLNETLKQHLREFDKTIILFSNTLAYSQNEYGEDTVQPIVDSTKVEIKGGLNEVQLLYGKNTLSSEESFLGIDIFNQNLDFTWWKFVSQVG